MEWNNNLYNETSILLQKVGFIRVASHMLEMHFDNGVCTVELDDNYKLEANFTEGDIRKFRFIDNIERFAELPGILKRFNIG